MHRWCSCSEGAVVAEAVVSAGEEAAVIAAAEDTLEEASTAPVRQDEVPGLVPPGAVSTAATDRKSVV